MGFKKRKKEGEFYFFKKEIKNHGIEIAKMQGLNRRRSA